MQGRQSNVITSLLYIVVVSASLQHPLIGNEAVNGTFLQLSAVVNEVQPPYNAKIECWELATPFQDYPTIGTSLPLANISNLTYVALPPKSAEGLHHPPHPMFFILLTGTAHVVLPGDPESEGLWIIEGINPVIVAADTLGVGHNTYYPGDKTTIALQAPFKDGVVPEHTLVRRGACPGHQDLI
ncbi:MAG: hypothetical protein Q9160_004488 [Pyrenula sp. 1 TL-2023]